MDHIAEIQGGPTGQAPPPNTALALWTDVRHFGSAPVLEWLHRARRSGVLRMRSGDHRKAIVFREGGVVFASSNQRIDRLGPSLARNGLLSIEALHGANREARATERFGKTLVTRGYLEPRRLWEGIRGQLEEIVWSLFAYEVGDLTFWEGEVSPDNLLRIDFDTSALLRVGREWADHHATWIARAGEPDARVVPDPVSPTWAWLEGVEAHIADALRAHGEAGVAFAALCRQTGIDEMTVARTLRFLDDAGLVTIEGFGAGSRRDEPGPDARGENLRRRLRGAAQASHQLAAPLRDVRDREAVWRRVSEVFDEIAARFPGAMNEVSLTHDLRLPVERLEKQILGGPETFERDAFAAIEALLDYLEFELLNHPEISEPDAILEAQATIRRELRASVTAREHTGG